MSPESRAPLRAGLVAVAVGIAVLTLKAIAAIRTGSLALFADGAESVVSLVAALMATASIRYETRSTDPQHPLGHGSKLEVLSAGIEGGLVVLAAFVVAFEALTRFARVPTLPALATGFALSIAATVANMLLARHLESVGRRHRSAVLLADAHHLRSHVVVSLVVYAGLAVAWTTSYWPLDALLALGVAAHILIAGLRAVRHSVSGLLDEPLADGDLRAIESRLRDEGPPVIGFDALKAHRLAASVAIEFDLVISRYALVYEAHEICDRIEADLRLLQPGARVTIRVLPEGDARTVKSAAATAAAPG